MSNPFEFFRTNANARKANVTQNNALYQDGRETDPVYGPMTEAEAAVADRPFYPTPDGEHPILSSKYDDLIRREIQQARKKDWSYGDTPMDITVPRPTGGRYSGKYGEHD